MAYGRKPRSSKNATRSGDALLDSLFRRLGLEDQARMYRALSAFHRAAGARIATRVRGERVHGSTLVLRVASAAWANELAYIKTELLEKLRRTPGGEWIQELRFSVGPLEEAPAWDEPAPSAPTTSTAEAPRIDDGAVAAALHDVTDPDLRRDLAELYARARHRT